VLSFYWWSIRWRRKSGTEDLDSSVSGLMAKANTEMIFCFSGTGVGAKPILGPK